MSKEPLILIGHILECIELIEEYCNGKNKEDFLEDREFQDPWNGDPFPSS